MTIRKTLVILPITLGTLVFLWFSQQSANVEGSLHKADEDFLHGKYSEAIRLYERLVQGNTPDATAARIGLLKSLLVTGQYARMDEVVSAISQGTPGPVLLAVQLLVGKSYLARGRTTEAEGLFRTIMASGGLETNRAQLELGLLLHSTGRLEESRSQFSALYERVTGQPDSPDLGLAAIALKHLGRFKESSQLFTRATQRHPRDLETWVAWGHLFLEKYNPDEAASIFEDALKLNPSFPDALIGLALSRSGQPGARAEQLLQRALEVNPNSESARVALANMAIESEAFDEATRQIETALEINPRSMGALAAKAVLHLSRGEAGEFQEVVKKILDFNGRYGEVYQSLAEYCVRQGLYRESVEFFRKAIAVNPNLWSAYSGLGINLLRLGDEEAAKNALETAYREDPYNVWTVNTLRLMDSYTRYQLHETEHFRLKLHEKESGLLDQYVPDLLEEAYLELSARYQYRPPTPIYLEMFPDHEDFAVRTLGLPGLGALGVCFGRGVVMDSPSARTKNSFNWGSTLWHELAHVMTLGITDHRIPRWFTEGLSVLEEHRAKPGWGNHLSVEIVKAIQEKKLLPISKLNAGFVRPRFPSQIVVSYFQAGQTCEYIEKRYGFSKILEMLVLFKKQTQLDDVLRQALGVSPSDFDGQFKEYIIQLYGKTVQAVDFTLLEKPDLLANSKALEELTSKEPDNFFANLRLAGYYRKESNFAKAIEHFRRARAIFPSYTERDNPYRQLSEIYREQGRLADAIAELTLLTEIADSEFDSLKRLAQWLVEAGRHQEAQEVLTRAMYVYPFDSESHQMLAGLSASQNDLRLALREYRALLALNPVDKAVAHFNLATVLFRMNRKAEAKKETLAALDIAPGYESAQELLLRLVD